MLLFFLVLVFPEGKGAIYMRKLVNKFPEIPSHSSAWGASSKDCFLLSFVRELMTGEKDLGF